MHCTFWWPTALWIACWSVSKQGEEILVTVVLEHFNQVTSLKWPGGMRLGNDFETCTLYYQGWHSVSPIVAVLTFFYNFDPNRGNQTINPAHGRVYHCTILAQISTALKEWRLSGQLTF